MRISLSITVFTSSDVNLESFSTAREFHTAPVKKHILVIKIFNRIKIYVMSSGLS